MNSNPKIAVFGGGSWATAIVKMLTENLENVGWYMRNVSAIEHIKKFHNNPNYLRSAELIQEKLDIYNDINYFVCNYDVLIFVISTTFLQTDIEKITVSLVGINTFSYFR